MIAEIVGRCFRLISHVSTGRIDVRRRPLPGPICTKRHETLSPDVAWSTLPTAQHHRPLVLPILAVVVPLLFSKPAFCNYHPTSDQQRTLWVLSDIFVEEGIQTQGPYVQLATVHGRLSLPESLWGHAATLGPAPVFRWGGYKERTSLAPSSRGIPSLLWPSGTLRNRGGDEAYSPRVPYLL